MHKAIQTPLAGVVNPFPLLMNFGGIPPASEPIRTDVQSESCTQPGRPGCTHIMLPTHPLEACAEVNTAKEEAQEATM